MNLAQDIADNHFIIWLNSNNDELPSYLSVGCQREIAALPSQNGFDILEQAHNEKPSWLFGYLGYDLKNDVEDLQSFNPDPIGAPKLRFVEPESLFIKTHGAWKAEYDNLGLGTAFAEWLENPNSQFGNNFPIELTPRITKNQYLNDIHHLQSHIQHGDIYEINYCQEFYANSIEINPLAVYHQLNRLTHTPFSAYAQFGNTYIMGGSPERFIKKEGDRLVSQPIKGTTKRSFNHAADQRLKQRLSKDPKERAENIMITDLVRNDLSKVATKGSVRVDELCGVYTFETVHQMISTISATMRKEATWVDVLRHTFPMGSMTGAPKIRAMQLIEQYEHSRRGIYSGAMGYITPQGDFDFNVVIRSLIYNAETQYLSATVGGAITSRSRPLKEYEECLLKADALKKSLR
ncbi:MAG: anthranilate synthase component I family protein [Flavobacteriales bacterium]|nr:anthranilate synthase component I family protein [Flavobacteriales bacterium]